MPPLEVPEKGKGPQVVVIRPCPSPCPGEPGCQLPRGPHAVLDGNSPASYNQILVLQGCG